MLVASTVARHGVDGLILATMMSGVFLLAIGYLRLGTYIKFIPYPVTVGFTAGIAVIIFASQLSELFGLSLDGKEPGELIPKLRALTAAWGTFNPSAIVVALLTIATIAGLKRWRPSWPGMLIGVAAASVAAAMLALPVETIGTRFGGIPRSLPLPALPVFDLAAMQAVLPDAIAFTLLGAIESLLSAVVADGMTGRRHRSNCELVAQGFANIGSALFGGICVTGTIARTATNIRAGAHGPVSGILHSGFLLIFMLVAAPLASYIPLAALAGVLAVVAWNMVEKTAFAALIRSSWGDALVLLVTFALVVFRDLTEGIVVGFALGSVLFIDRMSKAIAVETYGGVVQPDVADSTNGNRAAYDSIGCNRPGHGDLPHQRRVLLRLGIDGGDRARPHRRPAQELRARLLGRALPRFHGGQCHRGRGAQGERAGVRFFIAGASPQVRRMLFAHGVRPPHVRYKATVGKALKQVRSERVDTGDVRRD